MWVNQSPSVSYVGANLCRVHKGSELPDEFLWIMKQGATAALNFSAQLK